jgi:hypothetical protein
MNKQHAPGPWYARPSAGNDIHGQSIVASESTGKSIAVVYDGNADAQLIAAAPELLETLCSVLDAFAPEEKHSKETKGSAVKQALAAIAKAEGRNP